MKAVPPRKATPQSRENSDPREGAFPVPIAVVVLAVLLVLWGLRYIVSANLSDSQLGDGRSLASLTQASAPGADGAALFAANCQACHQASGRGLPGVFPPLAGSEWVQGPPERLAKIVLHGVTGRLSVEQQAFDSVMPTFGPRMSDAELAAVLSYIRSNWGNQAPAVDAGLVKSARAATSAHAGPWTGDELVKLQ